jgi:adenosylhomocysteine nucleosidase
MSEVSTVPENTPEEEAAYQKDMTSADVGIIHATSIELGPLIGWCDRKRRYELDRLTFIGGFFGDLRVAFCRCGMGPNLAEKGTSLLIDAHRPKFVISAGFSGSLSEKLSLYDVVHADSLVEGRADNGANVIEGAEWSPRNVTPSMPADEKARLHVGRLVTMPHMVRTVAEKKRLGEVSGALAVDMESAAVERICRERKVPFVGIRVISDDLSKDLPREVLSVVGATGSLRLGAAIGAMFKRPTSVMDMLELRDNANKAADRLSHFLAGILKQVPVD